MKNNVKFTDDTTLATKGFCDVFIERMDYIHFLIKNVIYIPGIKFNLLSIDQLFEKGYKIHM